MPRQNETTADPDGLQHCAAGKDGECDHPWCPQIRDGYCDKYGEPITIPGRPHRFCPLPGWGDEL